MAEYRAKMDEMKQDSESAKSQMANQLQEMENRLQVYSFQTNKKM